MAKGLYTLKYPEKYLGNPNTVRFMSSWELFTFRQLEHNPFVIKWASEEIAIPYFHPLKRKICDYYPDLYIEVIDKEERLVKHLIEIKPKKQASLKGCKRGNDYDKAAYVVNEAKWKAARSFCEKYGLIFQIVTEDELFKK